MPAVKETTRNVFSLAVEKKSVEEGIDYLDALFSVMSECDIEPENVAKLVNKSLKQKLEIEAQRNNLLKRGTAITPSLPI